MWATESEARAEIVGQVLRHAGDRLAGEHLKLTSDFVERYYARTDPEDLAQRRPADLYGAATSHLDLARHRPAGETKLHVYAPDLDRDGFASPHSTVDVVVEDMPFLVDSVTMALAREDLAIHMLVHPVIGVRRDAAGSLLGLGPPSSGAESGSGASVVNESFLHVELDRQSDPATLDRLRDQLDEVLGDVRAAVEDWRAMRDRALAVADALDGAEALPAPTAEREETAAFLRWLAAGHFVLLGYRDYELAGEGDALRLQAIAGSGLGILREAAALPPSHSFAKLPPEVRRQALDPGLLNLTKANSRSTVHRPSYLDYVGVKGFDATGKVVIERRFLGLYTSAVYKEWPQDIPILRRKFAAVVERAGYPADSHSGKALVEILDGYPRDELFQIDEEELFDTAIAILGLQERRRLRLFVRHDQFGRFVSCLVFLPRDRLTPSLERRIQEILRRELHGVHLEYAARFSESVLARLHLVIYTEPGSVPDHNVAELEAILAGAMRSFDDDLLAVLSEELGEERGLALLRRYAAALPAAYKDDVSPLQAAFDLSMIEDLGDSGLSVAFDRPPAAAPDALRLKLYRRGDPIVLSEVLPMLEHLGLQVVDERAHELSWADRPPVSIYDFGVRARQALHLDGDGLRERVEDAVLAVSLGAVEDDGFNRLVAAAGLTVREVVVLRAYARYLRQAGTSFGLDSLASALVANPAVARLLVALFRARFDPELPPGEDREVRTRAIAGEIERALEEVENLNEDQVLRRLLGTIQATLRTSFFRRPPGAGGPSWLSVKLDPSLVPDLPLPRPLFETYVYSTRMEGVHLRAGRVARGGIRWSDRLEDFRTEILGLMKAQTVKNAVIVPTGAKGGFVVRQRPAGGAEAFQAEGIACYQILIGGLLDLVDNLVDGKVVPPGGVVRHDGDDPYLVVAADKGTATFSDLANSIALQHGYWLGDAFASGGSTGYDHKAIGITARGTWVSVRRHFRDLGLDPERDQLTAVGIGDMSGDVFGNGMLLSPHLRLVAAFDHRHIFVDPDPDPSAAHRERARLFGLPRSSWADYDQATISAGGGIFPRSAKQVSLSEEARRALGIALPERDGDVGGDDRTDGERTGVLLRPDELIRAILRAPVDLLWNGGIGTYVRASGESDADARDKSNDSVRVSAAELRCRVVGEGGNLGFTQLARVEYARRGGKINTDAIDNSAGVDCSDHEVNIKILLDRGVADGALRLPERNALLAEMTDDVARHVLQDNEDQTGVLARAAVQAPQMVAIHARMISALERSGRLNRALELLPSPEELDARQGAGEGLAVPELAVVLAYTKDAIVHELLETDAPEDPVLGRQLEAYFPALLRERFSRYLPHHPLRREIVASRLTNAVVHATGTSFVFRLGEETGFGAADVVRAHAAAFEIFDLQRLSGEIESLAELPASTQIAMELELGRLAEEATRWLLRRRPQPFDIEDAVASLAPGVAVLSELLPDLVGAPAPEEGTFDGGDRDGPAALIARRLARLSTLASALDVVDIARLEKTPLGLAAGVYLALGSALRLDWLRDRIARLPGADRWQELARAALGDDLSSARARLAVEVLAWAARDGAPARTAAGALVDDWLAGLGSTGQRALDTLAALTGGGRDDLPSLSVAVRQIRDLGGAGGAPAAGPVPGA